LATNRRLKTRGWYGFIQLTHYFTQIQRHNLSHTALAPAAQGATDQAAYQKMLMYSLL
jgi:hypothetical protein